MVQRIFVRRANAASYVDSIVKDLNQLQADALEYWNLDTIAKTAKAEEKQRAVILSQKVKGAIRSIEADIDHFAEKYGNGVWGKACRTREFKKQADKLLDQLFDAATSGEFESAKKRAEPSRYLTVVNSIAAVRSLLLRTKL